MALPQEYDPEESYPVIPQVTDEEIAEYYRLKAQIKELEKKADKLNKKIKSQMSSSEIQDTYQGGFRVRIITQDRSKMNEERTIAKLKSKKLTHCIITKEVVDEAALEQALYDGQISRAELADCIDLNLVYTLKVDPIKE